VGCEKIPFANVSYTLLFLWFVNSSSHIFREDEVFLVVTPLALVFKDVGRYHVCEANPFEECDLVRVSSLMYLGYRISKAMLVEADLVLRGQLKGKLEPIRRHMCRYKKKCALSNVLLLYRRYWFELAQLIFAFSLHVF